MYLYAPPSWKLVRQILLDAMVLTWCLGWWFFGRAADGVVRAMAGQAHYSEELARQMQRNADEAAQAAAGIPLAGSALRAPFDELSAALGRVVSNQADLALQLETLATWLGWLSFVIPALLVVPFWVLHRVRFWLESAAMARLMARGADTALLSLRALTYLPIRQLTSISSDPVGAWQSGDRAVIDRLAEVERRRQGWPRRKRVSPTIRPPLTG